MERCRFLCRRARGVCVCVCTHAHACTSTTQARVRGNLMCRASCTLWLKHVPLPSLPATQPGPHHRPFPLGCLRWASHQTFVLLLLPRGRGGAGREGPPAEPVSCLQTRGHLFTQEISRKENHTRGGQGREGVPVAETGDGVKGTDLQFTVDKSWGGSVPRADYRSEDWWCMF